MKTHSLGRSDLRVSRYCLGTMTWGAQNTQEEAHAQIDHALDRGINFLDTAEMYPTTPPSAATAGDTERIIGEWFARTGRRSEVVLATKIVGKGNHTIRPGGAPINPETLRIALEGSLRRLRTDRIDLYQLHWPNRGSYHFRQNWAYDPSTQTRGQIDEMLAILETLGAFADEGKIRHIGLSNETAWGTANFLNLAEAQGLPRVVSIQNEYSLLHRIFDLDLAELCHHEEVGLLAFSPLAAGLLTGKYLAGARPPGSRGAINRTLGGRFGPRSEAACAAYVRLARDHGLDPAQMALAFCATRPFVGAVILGATTMDQLRTDIGAADLTLAPELMDAIAALHQQHPMPL